MSIILINSVQITLYQNNIMHGNIITRGGGNNPNGKHERKYPLCNFISDLWQKYLFLPLSLQSVKEIDGKKEAESVVVSGKTVVLQYMAAQNSVLPWPYLMAI